MSAPRRGSPRLQAVLSSAASALAGVRGPSSRHVRVSKGQVGRSLEGLLVCGERQLWGGFFRGTGRNWGSFHHDPRFGGHLEESLGDGSPRVSPCFLPAFLSLDSPRAGLREARFPGARRQSQGFGKICDEHVSGWSSVRSCNPFP